MATTTVDDDMAAAIDAYERTRAGPATREKVEAAGLLLWLLHRRGSLADRGGYRYSHDAVEGCVARVEVMAPIVGVGKHARKPWPKGMRYRRREAEHGPREG